MVVPSSEDASRSPRRCSARLQKLEPKCYYTSPQKRKAPASSSSDNRKKSKPESDDRVAVIPASASSGIDEKSKEPAVKPEPVREADDGVAVVQASTEGNAYTKVTETIRKFNKLYLHFVQVLSGETLLYPCLLVKK